jgi:long-chain acyl-CoA synthetase
MSINVARSVEETARAQPDKAALRFQSRDVTYAALDDEASRIADALLANGLKSGDRIALWLPNIPAFVSAYFGAMKIGAVAVSISSAYKGEEAEYILRDSGARALFTTADLLQEVAAVRASLGALEHVVLAEGSADGAVTLDGFIARASSDVRAVDRGAGDAAAILYTSGTTGKPKGAILTHGNITSNTRAVLRHARMSAGDVLQLFLPLFHCFGQNFILNSGLAAGATILLHRRWDPKECLPAIAREGVTMFFAVPTIYIGLLNAGVPKQELQAVRYYFSAAATMPEEVAKKWWDRFGLPIHEGYGLTETSPFAAYNHDRAYRPGSIGSPVEGVEMRVVGEDDREVPRGTWGEIVIRGPNIMQGYFQKAEESAIALRGGWFHSGDIGYVDADGYFYLVDRVKDMINAAGFKVWPREVEEIIYRHWGVKEAVVVGVPDSIKGEAVKAFIIVKENARIDPAEIIAFCRERIAAYKAPASVEIVAELPKSATGKILKRVLRDREPRS